MTMFQPIDSGAAIESAVEQASGLGQEEAYLEARRLYGPALVRLARGYELNPAHQQDLIQDIHVALWRSFQLFDQRCSLRTWVYRVAHNAAARHVQSSRRRRQRELFSLDEVPEPIDDKDAVAALDNATALQRLFKLIGALMPIDRQVILLYLEGLSAEAIADVVGLSARNVATKVHRIKSLLASMFQDGAKL